MIDQPRAIEPILDNIPAELKARRQWVVWRYLPPKRTGDKWRKVPHTTGGDYASTTNPATWDSYAAAVDAYNVGHYDGIGYVFTADDPYVGIDFDHSYNPQTGEFSEPALSTMLALNSYSELSASGTGVHVLVKGKLPFPGAKRDWIEIYKQGRFFTVSGVSIEGLPAIIEERQPELSELCGRLFKPREVNSTPVSHVTINLDDAQIIERARNAKNGSKFSLLWDGRWQGSYPSQSEAEAALAAMLRFWTQDASQMDRLMRASGLARSKWDSKRGDTTYGAQTVNRAIGLGGEVFEAGDSVPFEFKPIGKPQPEPSPLDEAEVEIIPPARYILHWADEAFLPQPPVEWIVGDLFQRGSVNLIYGAPGSKKTYIMLDCAVCVAVGQDWLRRNVEQGTVLLIDEESGERRLNRRLLEVMRGHKAGQGTPIAYTTLAMFNLLTCPADIQHLDALLGCVQPTLVIIDALADVMPGGDENEVKDTHPVFQRLKQMAHKYNLAVVVIHHANKQGKYRGSSAIPGVVDVMLSVTSPNGSDQITFVTEKNRDGEMQTFGATIDFDKSMQAVRLIGAEPVVQAKRERESITYVLAYLQEHGGGAFLDDICSAPDTCSPNAARQAVYDLAAQDRVKRTDGGGTGRGTRAYYQLTDAGEGTI